MLDTMRALCDECSAVARADGIALPDRLWQSVLDIAVNMAGQRSSTAQDLARGKKSEIEHLNGYVVRRGHELGVPVPVNRALLCSVQWLENKRSGPERNGANGRTAAMTEQR